MIYKTLKARQKVKDLAQPSIFYSRKLRPGEVKPIALSAWQITDSTRIPGS